MVADAFAGGLSVEDRFRPCTRGVAGCADGLLSRGVVEVDLLRSAVADLVAGKLREELGEIVLVPEHDTVCGALAEQQVGGENAYARDVRNMAVPYLAHEVDLRADLGRLLHVHAAENSWVFVDARLHRDRSLAAARPDHQAAARRSSRHTLDLRFALYIGRNVRLRLYAGHMIMRPRRAGTARAMRRNVNNSGSR